jgi:hypothetical protein
MADNFNSPDIMIPRLAGRFSRGTHAAMIVKAPLIIPDAPSPAIARETISIFEDVETPQSRDPNSKSARKLMKDH